MKNAIQILAKIAAIPAIVFSLSALAASLEVQLGKSTSLNLSEDITKVQIIKPGLIEVESTSDKRTLKFTGQHLGRTDVVLTTRSGGTQRYTILIAPQVISLQEQMSAAMRDLRDINGINSTKSGDKIVVSGIVANRAAGERLGAVVAEYKNIIVDNSEKPYRDSRTVAETVNSILDKNGMQNLRVRNYGKLLMLQGFAKDPNEKQLAMRIARLIDPIIEDGIESDEFSAGPSVGVDVMFIESVSQSDLSFGLQKELANAPGTALLQMKTAELTGSLNKGRIAWTVAPFATMLNLLQTKGNSKVVSNPRIVVRSGHEAKFHSGGTVYMKETTGEEKSIQIFPVNYGMLLNVRPKVDSLGQIDTVLTAEVSEFSANAQGALPGTTVSRTDTAVTLKDGHSVLLTGFKNVKERKQISRIPLLADIPLLGELFKNRRLENDERELLVLLTVRKTEVHEDQLKMFDMLSKTKPATGEFVELDQASANDVKFSIFD